MAAGDEDEGDDCQHLGQREPELELAVGLHRHQVGRGKQRDEDEADEPDGQGDPVVQQRGAGDRLGADCDDPEIPVQPGRDEAGARAEGVTDVGVERAESRPRHRHLAEHAHHQEDDRAGDRVAEDHRRPCRQDRRRGADEQPRADHPAERDHRDVAFLQRAGERLGGRRGVMVGDRHLRSRVNASELRKMKAVRATPSFDARRRRLDASRRPKQVAASLSERAKDA